MIKNVSFGMRDLSVPQTHWRDIPDFKFPDQGSVVLIMPGGTVDNPKSANGCIKRFLDSMGDLKTQDMQVLCAYYDDNGVPTHRIKSLKQSGTLIDVKSSLPKDELPEAPNYKPFFDKLLLSVLVDENKRVRSTQEICEKLNRLILVGYCYGGFVSFELAKILNTQLKKMKFSSKNRLKICKAFKVVACASRYPMQTLKSTVLHVVSYSDKQQERNWKHTNFHAFLNTKKRRVDKPAIVKLSENEYVLSAEKLLLIEMDDHHYRGYFYDYSPDFKKTDEGQFVTKFICEYISKQLFYKGKKPVSQIIRTLSNKKEIETRLKEGENLILEYKKRNLEFKKNFLLQEELVQKKDLNSLKLLLQNGQDLLPFKNKNGDFLIHLAIQNNDLNMVDLITKREVFWFQCFNSKGENPILIALKTRNLDMATLLWNKLMKVSLPTFETYQVLNSIKRRTFKSILLYIRKVPDAVLLLDKILKGNEFLPFKKEDINIIMRQCSMEKKQPTERCDQIINTLKKCVERFVDENGSEVIHPIAKKCCRLFSRQFVEQLVRNN